MSLPKLLIADGSEDFLLAMAQALQLRFHVLCCQDGKQALDLLRSEKCDMLILDLMLPELDGITLLETLAAENIRPTVLVTTLLLNSYVEAAVQRLHVAYLVRKPCTAAAVAARAEDLIGLCPPPDRSQEDRRFVSGLLLSLGLVAKHKGYSYLLECILSLAANPDQAYTKVLYPTVGKRFNRNGNHVERSIRSALDAAWKVRDDAVWQQYFPPSAKRPTGADFISRLAELLRQSWE